MNKTSYVEKRQIAAGAARSYLRQHGIDPVSATVKDALSALDDLARIDPGTIAAEWYLRTPAGVRDTELASFSRDWRRWQRNGE